MKSINPRMKVLLSVGGPEQSSELFLDMLSSRDSILQFATNVVEYLRKYGFDGIDIAWEFPGNSLPSPDLYTQLIRELRTAFNAEADAQGNDRLLLAVTLASTKGTIDASYDIPSIEPYIDYANILSYNYHNHCQNVTGLNAPLYSSQEERIMGRGAEQLNQNWTVNYFIDLGLPPDKINLGIPTFGLKFSLEHVANKGVGSPTNIPLNCLPDDDRVPYYQTCDGLSARDQSRRWVDAYDNEQEAPYASYGKEWITYESTRSIQQKAEFIVDNSLGGAMVWSLDRDDFSNSCGEGNFPLLNTLQETLGPTVQLCVTPSTPGTTPQRTALSQETTMKTTSAFKTTTQPLITTTPTTATAPTRASTVSQDCAQTNYRMVCYVTKRDYFPPLYYPDIDVNLCTHLIYAFASLNENTISVETTADTQVYHEVLALRSQNPNLKVLLSIGGWNHLQAPFNDLVSSDTNIDEFAQSAIGFLRNETFDGLDLAWLFPSASQVPSIQTKFTALLEALYKAFSEEAMSIPTSRLLLTVATGAKKEVIDGSYIIPELQRYADFVNVLAFDYHLRCADRTGMNAPLYAGTGELTQLNQNWTVNYYLNNGLSRGKLVMGIPVYGRQFRLANQMNNGPGQLTTGVESTCRRNSGITPYFLICNALSGYQTAWDNVRRVPFAYNTKLVWLTYDNERSVREKANFIKREDLGGAVVWSLNEEDFSGSCGAQAYPLVNTIRCTLSESGSSSSTTTKSTGTTTKFTGSTTKFTGSTTKSTGTTTKFTGSTTKFTGSTTKSTGTTTKFTGSTLPTTPVVCNGPPRNANEPQNFTQLCTNNTDLLPYNPDCTRFVQCEPDGWVIKNCSACLYFNRGNSVCDFPENVMDCTRQTTKSTGSTTKSTGTTPKFTGSTTKSTGPTTEYTGSTTKSTGTTTKFTGSTTKSTGTTAKFTGSTTKFTGSTTKSTGTTTKFTGSTTKFTGSTTKSTGSTTKFTGSTLPTTPVVCNGPPRNANEPQNFTQLCINNTDLLPYNPDCTRFVQCEPDGWVIKNCSACLYFNPENSVCDFPENVMDCTRQTTKSTGSTTKSTGTTPKFTGSTTKFTGPTTEYTGSTTKSTGITTKFTGSTTKSTGTTAKFTGSTTKFTGSTTKSTGTTTKFTGSTTKFTGSTTKSTGSTTKFTGSTLPTTSVVCNGPPRNANEPQNFTQLCTNNTDLLPYNPDCTRFVQCEPDGWVIKNCSACLYFNPGNSVCDFPENVMDCMRQTTKSTGSTTKSTGTTTKFTGSTTKSTGTTAKFTGSTTKFTGSTTKSTGTTTKFTGSTTKFTGSTTKSADSTTKFTGSTLPTTSVVCNGPPRNTNEPQNFTQLCANNTDLLPYNPDCTRFVQCEPDGWVIKNCSACLYFNPGNSVCDFPENVIDCTRQTTKSTGSTTKSTGTTTKFTGSTTKSTGPTTEYTGSTTKSTGTTTKFTGSTTKSTGTTTKFTGSTTKSTGTTTKFTGSTTKSTGPTTEYTGSTTKSTGTTTKFTGSTTKSTGTTAKFTGTTTKFTGSTTKSTGTTTKFTGSTTKSTGTTTKFTGSSTKSTTPSTASTSQKPCYSPQRPRNSQDVQNFDEMCFHNKLIQYNPDCRRYVHCEYSSWSIMTCPDCLYFSSQSNVCEYPEDVPDCQDPIPVITTTTASPSTAKKCTAPAKPRASTQSQDFVTLCRLAGDNAHLPLNTDCGSFVQCTFSNIGIYHVKRCPECQYFHIDSSRCELPGVVTDCQSAASVDITAPLKAPSTPDQCDLDGSFGHARRGFRLVQNFHALCLVDGQVIPVYNDCSCYVMCKGAGVWTLAVCPNGQFYDTNGKCIPQDQVTLCN
ncbi:uncharacterized protein LOC135470392 [Liolophura sinensis]|uniref:uncharacterized protein LOC135470392 n=1 Tax=Liolophura sinensis TaxID=3198878 RepID=UPI003158B56C